MKLPMVLYFCLPFLGIISSHQIEKLSRLIKCYFALLIGGLGMSPKEIGLIILPAALLLLIAELSLIIKVRVRLMPHIDFFCASFWLLKTFKNM